MEGSRIYSRKDKRQFCYSSKFIRNWFGGEIDLEAKKSNLKWFPWLLGQKHTVSLFDQDSLFRVLIIGRESGWVRRLVGLSSFTFVLFRLLFQGVDSLAIGIGFVHQKHGVVWLFFLSVSST